MFLFMTFWWIATFSFITDALIGVIPTILRNKVLFLLQLVFVTGLGGKAWGGGGGGGGGERGKSLSEMHLGACIFEYLKLTITIFFLHVYKKI